VSYEKVFSEDGDTKPLRGLQTSLEAFVFMLDKALLHVAKSGKLWF
jgi:hypothetical protein